MEQTLEYFVAFVVIALASHRIGKLFSAFRLPYITGYLFAGTLAGPFILEFLPEGSTEDLRFIDELTLAVIAFVAGSELYLKELEGRYRSIAANTFGIMVAAMILGGTVIFILTDFIPFTSDFSTTERVAVAILGSTILLALSPASTIAVIQEVRARGPFTKTILSVTVSMDVVIIVFFAISASIAAVLLTDAALNIGIVGLIAVDLVGAVVAGLLAGQLLKWVLGSTWHQYLKTGLLLVIGFLIFFLSFELTDFSKDNLPFELHFEPLLVAMVAGFFVTNFTPYRDPFAAILHDVGPYVYVAFFTLTGIALKLDVLVETLPIALTLFVVRAASIAIGSYAAGTLTGESEHFRRISWMAFITQAGIALGLAREVAVEFPGLGNEFATMIISVVVLNEIFGPMFLKSALRRAGETHLPEDLQTDEIRDAVILGIDDQSLALARQLIAHNWQVTLADTDRQKVDAVKPNGLKLYHLGEINEATMSDICNSAVDAIVAMMDNDEDNLKIAQLACEEFGTRRLIVRPRDLTHVERFTRLGASVIDPGSAMVNLLDQSVRAPQTAALWMHRDPEFEIVQVTVTDPDMNGVLLRDLRLPDDVLILGIMRHGHTILPHGATALHLEDEVSLIGSPQSLEAMTLKLGY
ncbi:MAG: potassium transporter TrkA [Chloroflexi bacterium]|nr:potassium transporter TrkA [Chloroflexota bacterium]